MAELSNIGWTDGTGNFWWGCYKVKDNPLCANCYAADWAVDRWGYDVWGRSKPRRPIAGIFNSLKSWQRKAHKDGRIHRVFVMSMGDIFEKSQRLLPGAPFDYTETGQMRDHFFKAISNNEYPNLLFQLLTKRPENIRSMIPAQWWGDWPQNVWVGVSAGTQETADRLIPQLLEVPAPVRFVSAEPLLGRLDLRAYLYPTFAADDPRYSPRRDGIDLVIGGGESGDKQLARPTHLAWARYLRNQCNDSGTHFFWKQWGRWMPVDSVAYNDPLALLFGQNGLDRHGMWAGGSTNDIVLYPDSLWLRNVGKKKSGRLLDGREWNGMPDYSHLLLSDEVRYFTGGRQSSFQLSMIN